MSARILHFIVVALLLGIFIPGRAHALQVNEVRFGAHPDSVRLVLDLSERSDFRVFALDNPYRLVIDLPDFEWRAGSATTTASSGVTALRYGNLQKGISRIVFDMAKPIAVKGAFIIPAAEGQPDRLVIDFAQVGEQDFAAARNNIFGTLAGSNGAVQNLALKAPKGQSVSIPATKAQILTAPPPQRNAKGPDNSVVKKPLIIIDPGHGGVDPGARGINSTNEKNVTLAIARALKEQLESTGRYRVALTRDKDVFIKLRDRVTFARDREADLFISIHADSVGSNKANVSGVSVYTLSEKASDAQTAKLAEQENKVDLIAGIDLSAEDQDVASILVDLAMRDTMNQSNFFANRIVDRLKGNAVRLLEGPHRSAGFAVLKAPDIPSVLIETGFMSNKKEVELLNSAAHREKLAKALTSAVDAYFEQVRKNQRI